MKPAGGRVGTVVKTALSLALRGNLLFSSGKYYNEAVSKCGEGGSSLMEHKENDT